MPDNETVNTNEESTEEVEVHYPILLEWTVGEGEDKEDKILEKIDAETSADIFSSLNQNSISGRKKSPIVANKLEKWIKGGMPLDMTVTVETDKRKIVSSLGQLHQFLSADFVLEFKTAPPSDDERLESMDEMLENFQDVMTSTDDEVEAVEAETA